MARSISLSLTLTRTLTRSTTRLTTARSQSTRPDPKTKEEIEKAAIKKLEEAIHNMIVKKAQPDWLPLVPGGSYWVPPTIKSSGFDQVLANLVKDSNNISVKKINRGFRSNRGWPSSAQFFIGESLSPFEGEMTSKQPSHSEEEG